TPSSNNSSNSGEGRPPPRVREHRVRTSDSRKAEIALLLKEAALLQHKLAQLQHADGAPANEPSLEQRSLDNVLIREQLRNQKFLVAGLKSALAGDTSEHVPSPVSSTLCLGSDSSQRWEFLRRLKPQKIHDARQFFRRRTQFMDTTRASSEAAQFETASGEICASKLDVFPLYGARSVKEVYDVLLFYFLNVEMCTAEVNGNVVVREEVETGDESVSQNRFVFSTKHDVQVETNNVIFCEYTPPRDDASATRRLVGPHKSSELDPSDEGLITLDFVDDDELYPYRPESHLRDDITNIFIVKSYPSDTTGGEINCGGNTDRVVVLGRWVQSKFHNTERCCLPGDMLFSLRTELDRVNDAIVVSVLDRFKQYTA
ncbi:hypothetical protein PybrP1_006338, partial [[Pythium] brassicae (nom. inval.)]